MRTDTFVYRSRILAPAGDVFDWHVRPGAFRTACSAVGTHPPRRRGERRRRGLTRGNRDLDWPAAAALDSRASGHRSGPPVSRRPAPRAVCALGAHAYNHPRGSGRLLAGGSNRIRAAVRRDRLVAGAPFAPPETAGDVRLSASHAGCRRHRSSSGCTGATHENSRHRLQRAYRQLAHRLFDDGWPFRDATRASREFARSRREPTVRWDPVLGTIDHEGLEGHDAVVHLAGENIASGRWNERQKKAIRDSRLHGTRMVCDALLKLRQPPKTLVCASAVGFYGDRGDEILDEKSPAGAGFLAEVCRDWEAATEPVRPRGIRVVNLRFGMVLSPSGGALAKMLLPFKLGLGGIIGSGRQYWSWIEIDDAVGAIHHALTSDHLSGPVNAVSPNPSTNRDFTKTLGHVLRRPTVLPDAGIRRPPRTGPDGRRAAFGQRPSRATPAGGNRLRVPLSRTRAGVAARAGH